MLILCFLGPRVDTNERKKASELSRFKKCANLNFRINKKISFINNNNDDDDNNDDSNDDDDSNNNNNHIDRYMSEKRASCLLRFTPLKMTFKRQKQGLW